MEKHKGKIIGGVVLAVLLALLQAWPMVCPLLPWKIECSKTEKLAEFGVTKLQELQDAGITE